MDPFKTLPLLPEDPILGLMVSFTQDPRPNKINLGIGAYKDSEGRSVVLRSVKKAEDQIVSQNLDKEYSRIEGNPLFVEAISSELIKIPSDKISFAAQTIGASGALRVGGDFLKRAGFKKVYISDPSWSNHSMLFQAAGLLTATYPYYKTNNTSIDFQGVKSAIEKMEEGSVILLQGCCHNPCGTDPSQKEWKELAELIEAKNVLPFFDLAYHGLGSSLDEDAFAVRYFAEKGLPLLIAYSCSKNFGVYGERVGALFFVNMEENKKAIASQVKNLIRSNYSLPPLHGARIVAHVLKNLELKKEWEAEVSAIRMRLQEMREAFVSALLSKGPKGRFDFLHHQTGMFSYTGLTAAQVDRLIKEFGIYLPSNGRINVAGLNWNNLDKVIDAIITVINS